MSASRPRAARLLSAWWLLLVLLHLLSLCRVALSSSAFMAGTVNFRCLTSDTGLTCTPSSTYTSSANNFYTPTGTFPLNSTALSLLSLPPSNISTPSLPILSMDAVSLDATELDWLCLVRADHSLACYCPELAIYGTINYNASTPLASWCPVSMLGALPLISAGRQSTDGQGWVGSGPLAPLPLLSSLQFASNAVITQAQQTAAPVVNSSAVQGYAAVHLTRGGSLCVLSYPSWQLSCNGNTSSVNWNRSPYTAVTLQSCLPPMVRSSSDAALLARPFLSNSQVVTLSSTLLTSSSFLSICLADGQMCGLLLSGAVLCWTSQSTTSPAAQIPWSPPSYLSFSSMTCGASSTCAVLSVPSLAGRVLCWSSAPAATSANSLNSTAMWQLVSSVVQAYADSGVQTQLYSAWQQDTSATGATACASWATAHPSTVVAAAPSSLASATATQLSSASAQAVLAASFVSVFESSQVELDVCGITQTCDVLCWRPGYTATGMSPPPSAAAVSAAVPLQRPVCFSSGALSAPGAYGCGVGMTDKARVHCWGVPRYSYSSSGSSLPGSAVDYTGYGNLARMRHTTFLPCCPFLTLISHSTPSPTPSPHPFSSALFSVAHHAVHVAVHRQDVWMRQHRRWRHRVLGPAAGAAAGV